MTGRLVENIYLVKPEGTDLTWKRHSEQMLRSFGLGVSPADESLDTDFEREINGLRSLLLMTAV